LDQLGESARQATLEMSNIPHGFRQARLAFEAQTAGGSAFPGRVDLPLVNVRGIGGDGAALPLLAKALENIRPGGNGPGGTSSRPEAS
jgi:hypothetical protein